ncbi:MAG: ABC1 kinase family protein [Phycisphaeraceae bacterium]
MSRHTAIGRTLLHAHRSREILTVLVRYGFEDVLHELGLDRVLERGRKMLGMSQAEAQVRHLPQAVRLRKAMEELGPTFIKLGQVLSMRPDLIPAAWAEEFAKLQDDVPPATPEAIQQRLDEEFGHRFEAMFESFDREPFAAASIAQTHRAVFRGGQRVVLKILRPGIRDTITADIGILRLLAGWAEDYFQNLGYSPVAVVDQFDRELRREIDLRHEARATDRLRSAFADNEHVFFPQVYWETTTSNVLTMEEILGTPLSKLKDDQFTPEQRRAMIRHGTDAVFRQCLQIGFFHADPHPGNIMALPDGNICFIDCGMVGHIDPGTMRQLADLVHGVLIGNLDTVLEVTLALADADPNLADNRAVRADVWEFVSRFEAANLDQLDMGNLLQEFFTKVRRHRLRCPPDLVFLIKALTTIEGVGERIDPDFDVVRHVRPHVERMLQRRYGIRALRRRIQQSVRDYTDLAEVLPKQLRALVFAVRRNQITVNLEHRGLSQLTDTVEHASRNIARALVIAAMLIGSSILILADAATSTQGVLSIVGIVGFIFAGVISAIMLIIGRLR